jgi:hypothetical protein
MKTTAVGAPLRHPAFQRLWLGLSILYLGDQFTIIVLLWFVLQLTGSGPAVGLVIPLLRPPRRRHRGDPRASAGSPPAAAGDGLRQPRPSGTHRGDSHALRPGIVAALVRLRAGIGWPERSRQQPRLGHPGRPIRRWKPPCCSGSSRPRYAARSSARGIRWW